jgi:hypothetical protein
LVASRRYDNGQEAFVVGEQVVEEQAALALGGAAFAQG